MYGCKKIMASCMRLTERRRFREQANRHHPNPVRRVGVSGISAVIGALQGNTRTIFDCAGVCDSLCITLRREREQNVPGSVLSFSHMQGHPFRLYTDIQRIRRTVPISS